MPLTAGTRLGPYEIVSPLGAGGMGEVYRARDTRLSRDVAIKVLPASYSTDPDRLRRFEQEARATAALNHPNILAVFDVGMHDGAPYVVAELLYGETLRERLSIGALPLKKAVDYAVQICQGLAAAHEGGIVHRDLKPENLFVTREGRVKILDFGLAKLVETLSSSGDETVLRTEQAATTSAELILGTPAYMSPEQVRGQPLDHRTDIFAFGAVLYEMVSGRRAFQAATAADTMTAILKDELPPLSVGDRRVTPGLSRIVERCLEKNPDVRFKSADDLAFALRGLSQESESVAVIPPVARRPAVKRLASLAVALAIGAAGAIATVYPRHKPDETGPIRFTFDLPEEANIGAGGGGPAMTLSPDGRYLAFAAISASGRSLWLRSFADSLEAQKIAGTEGAARPFWSPDSRYVGFFSDGKLKTVSIRGGPAQELCDAPAGQGGTWSHLGMILFAPGRSGLFQVPASGGEPRPVTTLDLSRKETAHQWPQFLPDGRRFLYFSAGASPDSIFLGSLDSPAVTPVLASQSQARYSPQGYVLFVSQGTLRAQPFDVSRGIVTGDAAPIAEDVSTTVGGGQSAFAVSDAGVLAYRTNTPILNQMEWLDRTGGRLGTLGEAAPYVQLSLSRDGTKVAVQRNVGSDTDLWILDAQRGVPTRFTQGPADAGPVWSPDGRALAFRSAGRGGSITEIFRKSLSGTHQESIETGVRGSLIVEDWLSDDKYVLALEGAGTGVWAVPLHGSREPLHVVKEVGSVDEPQFSPDGKWIAYHSGTTGADEIYVQPFPGPGESHRISSSGGRQPKWRADTRELFYLALNGALMSVDFTPDAAKLTSVSKMLFQTRPNVSAVWDEYVPDADGQRFLMLTPTRSVSQTPLTVVVNWTRLLNN